MNTRVWIQYTYTNREIDKICASSIYNWVFSLHCTSRYPDIAIVFSMCVFANDKYIYVYMGLRQNSGMDRPAVIQTYGSVWITCVLVWIGGMDRSVGPRYGSGLYILTRSHICIHKYKYVYIYIQMHAIYVCYKCIYVWYINMSYIYILK